MGDKIDQRLFVALATRRWSFYAKQEEIELVYCGIGQFRGWLSQTMQITRPLVGGLALL